jgi:hypothetical protein
MPWTRVIASASCRLLASIAGLAAVVSVAVPSRGDEARDAPRPAADASTPAPTGAKSLALVVDADAIDAQPLKQMLEDDLSISIDLAATSPPPALTVRSLGPARVEVVFIRPDGSEIHRTLDLPRRRPLATETVAYAAANLLRDEAADLLASLQKASPRSVATSPPRATALVATPPPAERPAPPACSQSADLAFGFDLAPRVGTSSAAPNGVRVLSVNLFGGLAGGLHGFELGAGVNIERQFACGLQVAGVSNVVGGPVEGAQVAPLNWALGGVQGLQVGVVQIARASMKGVQFGPLNLVTGPLAGSQLGTTNIVGDRVSGAQIGVVNIATGRVQGTQVGLVNYADDSDASIGLVSVVRHGHTDVEAWGTESGLAIAGLRHGSALLHNVYGAGVQLGGQREWALVFGLGVHASLAPWMGLDVDLLQTWMQKRAPFTNDVELSTIQAAFGIPIAGVVEVLVAPTFNVLHGADRGTGLAPPWPTFDFFDGSTSFVHGWVGISAGLRLRL